MGNQKKKRKNYNKLMIQVLLNAEAVKYGWGHSLKSHSYMFGSSTERMISC